MTMKGCGIMPHPFVYVVKHIETMLKKCDLMVSFS